MADLGVVRLLYTDIARDGALTGPDLATNARLAEETGLAVQASGGVASVEHIKELLPTGVEGVIVGMALYTGTVNLAEAVAAVA
jgi:phosphoribosylformimino-5-aminoimidazole carboxamide ribotide isomerase